MIYLLTVLVIDSLILFHLVLWNEADEFVTPVILLLFFCVFQKKIYVNLRVVEA